MDQLTGEYTRSCAYIEFGLQENVTAIPVAVGPTGQELYSAKTKALFASVFDRLSRYPILLKETERYYEVSSAYAVDLFHFWFFCMLVWWFVSFRIQICPTTS